MKSLICFIANCIDLHYSVDHYGCSYPRDVNIWSAHIPNFKADEFLAVVDYFEHFGAIDHKLGRYIELADGNTQSKFRPTEDFIDALADNEITLSIVQDATELVFNRTRHRTVKLKSGRTKTVEDKRRVYPSLTDEIKQIRQEVREFRRFLSGFEYSVNGLDHTIVYSKRRNGEPYRIVRHIKQSDFIDYRRVFRLEDDAILPMAGGRYYAGVCGFPKATRKQVHIDGVPVRRLDAANLHPRLAHAIVGVSTEHLGDPYDLDFDDGSVFNSIVDCEQRRDIIKTSVLIFMNAQSKTSALRAIADEIKTLDKYWTIAKELIDKIDNKYRAIRQITLKPICWKILQTCDAYAMSLMIKRAIERGICILPIHDELLCQDTPVTVEEVKQIMRDSYSDAVSHVRRIVNESDEYRFEVQCDVNKEIEKIIE
ncbi:MAG: hypothetical protein HQL50_07355 [Magnetococcales bacterium]|nr:hypothetical protein [Magnetococcales bacterium]